MTESLRAIVGQIFEPFVRKHGFHPVSTRSNEVTYKSTKVLISIFYDDHRSFEVDVSVRKLTDVEPAYSLDEIFDVLKVPLSERPMGYSVLGPEDLKLLVIRITELLETYACEFLDGNCEAWSRLLTQRARDSAAVFASVKLKDAKVAAQAAWSSGNYAAVVKAFEGFVSLLSPSELAKLKFARRRINNEN